MAGLTTKGIARGAAPRTVQIALLRGVNVAGNKMVAMSDLRALLASLGFESPQSLLQSGNLVFRSDPRAGPDLERLLESEALSRLGLETEFFVRSAQEWRDVVLRNPFRDEARDDPGHLLVMALKNTPDPSSVDALRAAISGRETVHVDGRHAYMVYPHGVGRSRLTSALIDKKLGTRCTGRNWNTVLKLGALAEA